MYGRGGEGNVRPVCGGRDSGDLRKDKGLVVSVRVGDVLMGRVGKACITYTHRVIAVASMIRDRRILLMMTS